MPPSVRGGDVTAAGQHGVLGDAATSVGAVPPSPQPQGESPALGDDGDNGRNEDDGGGHGDEVVMDKGLKAWLQVLASFALYFNHLGLLNGFGVFQTFYENELLSDSSPSAISWIGSIQIFCLMAIAVFVGPLYDAGYCRALIVTGTCLVVVGFMLTSVSTKYWQILLAQGIVVGLGTSFLSVPSIANVPMYFDKRRALAMGLASVGSGLGATIYPLIFQSLQPKVGFGWTVRVYGFIALAMCLFAIAVTRPRTKPLPQWRKDGLSIKWFYDSSAFKERTFITYCIAIFFNNVSFFQPNFYIQSYALANGMAGQDLVHYLLSILNASSIPGRIVAAFVADWIGSLDTYSVICAFSSASLFYWISVSNTAGNIAFPVLYGFFSGGVVALGSVVLTEITPDMGRLGTRLGMVSIIKGVASLVGPPISGALLGATGSFLSIQLFSAFGIMLTALGMVFLRVDVARTALRKKRREQETEANIDTARELETTGQAPREKTTGIE